MACGALENICSVGGLKKGVRVGQSMMDRDADHVYHFLQNELGTSGNREKGRILLKGRIPPRRIKERIVAYVKAYILCHQCNAPDTSFLREDRTTLLKCQACGGTRPVKL